MGLDPVRPRREPWNEGEAGWPEGPAKVQQIWAIRVRLQMQDRVRELALFDLAIDGKLRGGDLVRVRVRDVCHGERRCLASDGDATEDPPTGAI